MFLWKMKKNNCLQSWTLELVSLVHNNFHGFTNINFVRDSEYELGSKARTCYLGGSCGYPTHMQLAAYKIKQCIRQTRQQNECVGKANPIKPSINLSLILSNYYQLNEVQGKTEGLGKLGCLKGGEETKKPVKGLLDLCSRCGRFGVGLNSRAPSDGVDYLKQGPQRCPEVNESFGNVSLDPIRAVTCCACKVSNES